LDLFLEYKSAASHDALLLYANLSDTCLRILEKLPQIAEQFGRKTADGVLLQTKFLFPELKGDNRALDGVVDEIIGCGVATLGDDQRERAILFLPESVRKAVKFREWFPKFEGQA
jgi:hypothetical protein